MKHQGVGLFAASSAALLFCSHEFRSADARDTGDTGVSCAEASVDSARPERAEAATPAFGDPAALAAAYRRWEPQYERLGGGHRMGLRLAWVKGLSGSRSPARGRMILHMDEGRVEVDIADLPPGEAYDVWLVDNEAGPGRSVRPEDGDRSLWLGRIVNEEGIAHLDVRPDPEELSDFDVDLAVVTRSGAKPGAGELWGIPGLFQRVYHERRGGAFQLRPDEALPAAHVPAASLVAAAPAAAPIVPAAVDLVTLGESLFFDERFRGNGRTCASCHPSNNNFTLDPKFIASLPDSDALFIAERRPELAALERPELVRELGLILENVDGFDRPGVMRGVPHVLALGTSIAPPPLGADGGTLPPLERLGWSGDGAPGNGTLREFAIGAVVQHAPRRLNRIEGVDFRLPTEIELDALEAFQLSLGRSEDPDLAAMNFRSPIVTRGRELFLQEVSAGGTIPAGKCNSCHSNGGASVSPSFLAANSFPPGKFNFNLDIGTKDFEETLGRMVDPRGNPQDMGFGQALHPLGGFGDGQFNVVPLIEAPDTGPYFHDNSVLSLEGVVAFYLGAEFNGSPAANQRLRPIDNPPGFGVIGITDPEQAAVASMLRVLNALENIRSSKAYVGRLLGSPLTQLQRNRVRQAILNDLKDGIEVLEFVKTQPEAAEHLREAGNLFAQSQGTSASLLHRTLDELDAARAALVVD